jgi:hypothetical protein
MAQDRMTLRKVAKWLAWSMIAMAVIVFTAVHVPAIWL